MASATQSYSTRTVRTRNITFTYYTEIVTVTVNTNVTGVTAEGQVVTINGVNTTIPASGQVTQKVAFNTSYGISVNNKSLYNSPSSLSYRASLVSRNVTMTYTKITSGVFALTTTGDLIPEKDINTSSPSSYVGVAILSGNISFFFNKNIPIGTAASADIANFKSLSQGWYLGYYGYSYDVDGVTQIEGNDMSVIRNTAFNVYNNGETGISNTNIIANHTRTQYDTAQTCATRYYNTVKNQLTNTYNGYIPSLAELFVILDNITSVLSVMSKIGGTDINGKYIWSSVFSSSTLGDNKALTAWVLYISNDNTSITTMKSNSNYTYNMCLVCFPLS